MRRVRTSDVEAEESTSKVFTGGRVTKQGIFGKSSDEFRVAMIHFTPGAVSVLNTHTFD